MSLWLKVSEHLASCKKEPLTNLEKAIEFYKNCILKHNRDLEPRCKELKFPSKIPAFKWEMFCAYLTGDHAKETPYGHDLTEHEVKSAKGETKFEYQYHRNSYWIKNENERYIYHLYVSYDPGWEKITVRKLHGSYLKEELDEWLIGAREAYSNPNYTKDRYRRSVSYKRIADAAKIILIIEKGKTTFYDEDNSDGETPPKI